MDLNDWADQLLEREVKTDVARTMRSMQLDNWASVTLMDAASAAIKTVVEGAQFCEAMMSMTEDERAQFLRYQRESLCHEVAIRLNGLQ